MEGEKKSRFSKRATEDCRRGWRSRARTDGLFWSWKKKRRKRLTEGWEEDLEERSICIERVVDFDAHAPTPPSSSGGIRVADYLRSVSGRNDNNTKKYIFSIRMRTFLLGGRRRNASWEWTFLEGSSGPSTTITLVVSTSFLFSFWAVFFFFLTSF